MLFLYIYIRCKRIYTYVLDLPVCSLFIYSNGHPPPFQPFNHYPCRHSFWGVTKNFIVHYTMIIFYFNFVCLTCTVNRTFIRLTTLSVRIWAAVFVLSVLGTDIRRNTSSKTSTTHPSLWTQSLYLHFETLTNGCPTFYKSGYVTQVKPGNKLLQLWMTHTLQTVPEIFLIRSFICFLLPRYQ